MRAMFFRCRILMEEAPMPGCFPVSTGVFSGKMRDLSNALHVNRFRSLRPPLKAAQITVLMPPFQEQQQNVHNHLCRLCDHYHHPQPPPGAREFSAALTGNIGLVYGAHREFCTFAFVQPDVCSIRPFLDNPMDGLPKFFMRDLPAEIVTAAFIEVESKHRLVDTSQARDELAAIFNHNNVMGGEAKDGRCRIYTDMRHDEHGFVRFLLTSGSKGPEHSLTGYQFGNVLQKLFDIETYRMMAMLTIPVSKKVDLELEVIRSECGEVMSQLDIASGQTKGVEHPRMLLDRLCHMSSITEKLHSDAIFRFRAAEQYHPLVVDNLRNLRMTRVEPIPSLDNYIIRQFEPAMRACKSVASALIEQNEQNARSVALLQAYVSVAMQEQNKESLKALSDTADTQLKLQHAVEGLSIICLSYYFLGLVGYVLKSADKFGILGISPEYLMGPLVPLMLIGMRIGVLAVARGAAHGHGEGGNGNGHAANGANPTSPASTPSKKGKSAH